MVAHFGVVPLKKKVKVDSQLYIWFMQVVNAKNMRAMEMNPGPQENTVPMAA